MNHRVFLLIGLAVLLGAHVAGEGLFTGSGSAPITEVGSEQQSSPAAPPPEPVAAAMMPPGAPAKLNPLEGLAAKSFSAMLERPLFNPRRSPRPEAPPPPPPPTPLPEEPPVAADPVSLGPDAQDFKLLAIATGPSGRVVALRLAASGEVLYLRKGNSVDAWTVIDVNDKSLVLGTPENNVTLSLFEEEQSAAPDMQAEEQLEPAP